jgi:hypothetical protein
MTPDGISVRVAVPTFVPDPSSRVVVARSAELEIVLGRLGEGDAGCGAGDVPAGVRGAHAPSTTSAAAAMQDFAVLMSSL